MLLPAHRLHGQAMLTDHRSAGQDLHRSKRPRLSAERGGRPLVEEDVRYRRVDFSDVNAWKARRGLAEQLARGESGVELAKVSVKQLLVQHSPTQTHTHRLPLMQAALLIAAEDDALVSHSTVELPVNSFLARMERLVDSLARSHVRPDQAPEEAVQVRTAAPPSSAAAHTGHSPCRLCGTSCSRTQAFTSRSGKARQSGQARAWSTPACGSSRATATCTSC